MTPRLPFPVGEAAAVRARRIAEIRRLIERGEYRVPARLVADAVLEAWRGGPPKEGPPAPQSAG